MGAAKIDDLFPDLHNPEGTQIINERCLIRTQDEHRVVLVSGMVLAQYTLSDPMAEAYARVQLVEQGWAPQQDVARAFQCSARTVRRDQRRFEEGGLAALEHRGGYPPGRPRLTGWRPRLVQQLKSNGYSQREIARRIGVGENAIRKLLRRLGWKAASPLQTEWCFAEKVDAHPNLSGFADDAGPAPAISRDTDPSERSADRLLARLGLLEEAPPLFGSASAVPRAGVLLALPVLIASGVFECAQNIYGSIGPSFYGLRTSLLTLLLMALWRIKRPENLKEYSPQSLGRVLGLDRAPEVKTLRRKLASLAATGRAAQFGDALAPATSGATGQGHGFPLRRRPRAGVSRPTRLAQSARGTHAHCVAGHLGLLGQ